MSTSFTVLLTIISLYLTSFAQEKEQHPPTLVAKDPVFECRANFKSLFPEDDQRPYETACFQDSIRDLILEKAEPPSENKSSFLKCVETIHEIKGIPYAAISDCAMKDTAVNLMDPEFPKCFKSTESDFSAFDAYQECKTTAFLIDYKSESFKECRSRLKNLKQEPLKILNLCKNQDDRNRIASKAFEFCEDELDKGRIDNNTIVFFCNQTETLETLIHPEYLNCRASVASMTKNKNAGLGLCSFSPQLLDVIQKNKACIFHSVQAAYKNYIIYSAFAVKRKGDGSENNYFLSLINDCSVDKKEAPEKTEKNPIQVSSNPYLKLLKDYNLHSSEKIEFIGGPKPQVLVGGGSALHYDSKNENLYILSDEAYMHSGAPARMYVYELNRKLELRDSKTIPFTYGNAIPPYVDGEGLVRLKDGRFIVSSEVGESTARHSDQNGRKTIPSMNLNIFDREASYLTHIPLPESFRSRYLRIVEKSYLKATPESSNIKIEKPENISGRNEKSIRKESKKDLSPLETVTTESVVEEINENEISRDGSKFNVPKAWLFLYGNGGLDDDSSIPYQVKISHYIIAGLQYNKSIESLGLSPDESTLFLANEASLYQDMKHNTGCIERKPLENGEKRLPICRQMVRVARMSRVSTPEVFRPHDEFKYELEAEVENGVSEILPLSSLEFLILERSWDAEKQKVTARIYKASASEESLIPKNASNEKIAALPPLKKKLILDLDQVISQLSPGLKSIDNFEGMTFGPTLENGNRTLLLVSDNNFSQKQKTLLLVFEILQELTEKSHDH